MHTNQTNKFRLSAAKVVLASAIATFSFSVNAGTATSDLSVTATVAANCTIATSAVAFGSYDPIVTHKTAALNGTGSVTVTCTNGSSGTITLGQGLNPVTGTGGSTDAAPQRQLASGTNRLTYQLYSDSARTVVWGNTAATGVVRTGTGAADAVTVFGQMPANQNKPAGSYTDTVVATVTF